MIKKLLNFSILSLAMLALNVCFAQNQSAKIEAVDYQVSAETLPYINYKGITDPELAKKEWVNDNPEAYQELVGSQNNSTSNVLNNLSITIIPNDDCSSASPVACGSTVSGTNVGASAIGMGCGPSGAPAVWYAILGDGQPVTAATCGYRNFDTRINVFTGTCNTLSSVDCNDDYCGLGSQVTFNTTSGTVYYVVVSGFASAVGNFDLTISGSCTAPNTTCQNPMTSSISASGLKSFWGTPDPNTFYFGVGQWKQLRANHTGGVGPYTYNWSVTGPGTLKNQSGNRISLFDPTGPVTVSVTIDDASGCQTTASLNIGWDNSFFCGTVSPRTWYLTICDDGVTSCVDWLTAKTLVKSGNAVLGACNQPTKMDPGALTASLYPNPTANSATLEYRSETEGKGTLFVFDINGRMLQQSEIMVRSGVQYQSIELSEMPNGTYIVKLSTDHDVFTEKLQVIK